jgi:hypothetical protein
MANYQYVSLSSEPKSKWRSECLEKGYAWRVQAVLPGHAGNIIGVDPGVNFGITLIKGEVLFIFNGKLKTQREQRIEYSLLAYDLLHELIKEYEMQNAHFILEGAAFNKKYGQVNLAEVRTGYYLAMRYFGTVVVPAPMSWRKITLGSGTAFEGDIWPRLNGNAAASLGIALSGI